MLQQYTKDTTITCWYTRELGYALYVVRVHFRHGYSTYQTSINYHKTNELVSRQVWKFISWSKIIQVLLLVRYTPFRRKTSSEEIILWTLTSIKELVKTEFRRVLPTQCRWSISQSEPEDFESQFFVLQVCGFKLMIGDLQVEASTMVSPLGNGCSTGSILLVRVTHHASRSTSQII